MIPKEVDQRAREAGLTLADLRAVIPAHCLKPRPVRSWWTLLRILVSVAVCLFLLSRVELGAGQGPRALVLAQAHGWTARLHPDLASIDRVLEARLGRTAAPAG